ncbi:ribonuclease E/G [Pelagibius sp. Alg239-R121]|uniref:ribonuclease E/G n=1 Tax=Pelagibius sp. Alg239-R121 TaxID=2993448 RepID=UPI0024A72C56|nr:ribonuclease E/G [Pelagibius sp. Alg239-R121]
MTGSEDRLEQGGQERSQVPARIVVSALPGEVRAACLRADRLEDLLILRADHPRMMGNIYQGRVLEISPSLDAAFVDIGLARPGFLPRGEAPGKKQLGRALSDGDAVTVKVVREASEDKGVRLTSRIDTPPDDLATLATNAKVPSLLMEGDDPLLQLIARQGPIDSIICDDSETCNRLKHRIAALGGDNSLVVFDPAPRPLFEQEGAEEQIESLLGPYVELPGGGSLLIEPVRTLTAIDVNLGAMAASGTAQAQALTVNLEAAVEIARQLRLRAIAGLIVVDLLELREKSARARVIATLRKALEADDQPCQVAGMSPSGLLEMTRRRGGPPLADILTEPAGEQGWGRQRDAVTLAFGALRGALGEADAAPGCEVVITAPSVVLAALREGAAAEARQVVERRLGRALRLETQLPVATKTAHTSRTVEVLAIRR